jgi:hypothetical protein
MRLKLWWIIENGKLKSRQSLEPFACLVSCLSDTGVPVLPTTPVIRLAHVGCGSKWLRNVVFPVGLVWDEVVPCCLTRDVQCLYPFPSQEKPRSRTEVRAL